MTTLDPTPRVGDVVHYVSYGTPGGEYPPACRAAVVTEVPDPPTTSTAVNERLAELRDRPPSLGLCVLNTTGIFFRTLREGGCRYASREAVGADDRPGGTWHPVHP